MKKILIAASVALIAMGGCKKETVTTGVATPPNAIKAHQKVWQDDAANPDNPYDDVGYWHNIALEETRASWQPTTATFTTTYNGMSDYIAATGAPYTLPNIQTLGTAANTVLADTPNKYKIAIANSSLSTAAKAYEYSLMDIIFDSGYTSYADFKTACISLEKDVIADKTLTAADKEAVLSSASIARHSMIYWQNEVAGENGSGGNPVLMRGIFGWLWRIGYTVGGDAVGFGVGGPAGAAVFSAYFGWLLLQ